VPERIGGEYMKYGKLQSDILKAVISGKKKSERYVYGETGDDVVIFVDRVIGYVMDKRDLYLDIDKCELKKIPVKGFFSKTDGSYYAVKTGYMRHLQNENGKSIDVVKIANEKTYAWVDTGLLKLFDDDCQYEISAPNHPVYVYEKTCLVGMLLPVAVKED
jgi:hypothetical protein